MTATDPGLETLESQLSGESRLLAEPDVMDAYRYDQASLVSPGQPLAVLLAGSAEDVATALAWAADRAVPVVPRGAGTGLAGGAAALDGCLVLSTARMNRIREISVGDRIAVVEPGVITADLDRAAADVGLMYAPDPSSVEMCTIGGNVATNAGGLRCVKYGVTRDSVLGLQAALPSGRLLRTGHRTIKGVTGLDLTGLFVGSEGTLGVITEVTVKLRPRPAVEPTTLVATFKTLEQAGEAVAAVLRSGVRPSLLELMDAATVRAIDEWKNMGLGTAAGAMLVTQTDEEDPAPTVRALTDAFEGAATEFVAVSCDPEESRQLLEVRRLAYPAAERLGSCLVEDVAVPPSQLPAFLRAVEKIGQAHDVRIMTVAHAGDGNAHPTFVFDRTPAGEAPPAVWAAADEVFRSGLALGGTLSGEHGIGVLKQRWLGMELSDDSRNLQHAIKAAFDPTGILNPGRAI